MVDLLFSTEEVSAKINYKSEATSYLGNRTFEISLKCKASKLIENIIGKITPGSYIEFCTEGNFSNHQLLQFILEQTGSAIVHLSSWAIKEDSARALVQLKKSGAISELYTVFDSRVKTQDAKHFDFLKSFLNGYGFTKCHAKVMVIQGKEFSVTVIGSANFSRKPRIEVGVINCSYQSANFHVKWLNQYIN